MKHLHALLLSLLILHPLEGRGQSVDEPIQSVQHQTVDLNLTSTIMYHHPIRDVEITCTLSGPGGLTYSVAGFWDGGVTYRVRFALPLMGRWNYSLKCSDTTNAGLHGIQGTVEVFPYTGTNLFNLRGWPTVSAPKRYLTYSDGTPFFYLGDTAWEIVWKSRESEVLSYVADRKQKGFTVLQVVAMSHQHLYKYGILNRHGETFFLDEDFSRVNPRYFDYLDRIIQTANDSGLVVALVPLWAAMMEHYVSDASSPRINEEQALLLARYIGARYAGSNVIWIIGGDNEYQGEIRRSFWGAFARTIKRATGGQQLATVHPRGFRASFDYYNRDAEWIDFHMYQSSHLPGTDFTWCAAQVGYALNPPKPVLNAEACYEDIYSNLWEPGDTTRVESFRITPVHVRQAIYESVLSGALVGATYGANGIWQWHTQELPGSHSPRYTVDSAPTLPGSSQMGVLKRFMGNVPWHELIPSPRIVRGFRSEENFLPAARTTQRWIIYVPQRTSWFALEKRTVIDAAGFFWVNPATGDTVGSGIFEQPSPIVPPDSLDWLFVLERQASIGLALEPSANPYLAQNYPNPFNWRTFITYYLPVQTTVALKIYTLIGEEVALLVESEQVAGSHQVALEGTGLSTGVYICQLQAGGFSIAQKLILLR